MSHLLDRAADRTTAPEPGSDRGPTIPRVLAAEWTKITSLRSTAWLAAATVVAAAGLAFGLGLLVRPGDAGSGASLAVTGHVLAQLGPLVLGVLVGTGEHATGTFRATFTAVPRRLPVLGGQAVVTAGWGAVVAAAAVGASLLVTSGQRADAGLVVDVTDAETVRLLAGYVLHQTGVALLGLGIGALVRRATGALVTAVMLLLVLDQFLATNPGRFTDTLRALLPAAGARLVQGDAQAAALDATSVGPDLGTWGGGLVLLVWVVALLAAAFYRLRRHDLS
ncbi:hypothetical protein ACFVQ3_16540 [Oerskovia sp. NPDC057915]|uniref:hypothetical protein n=1 Tax=Oerskovia sp. NPDC057915 TaxID=3346280 RepID=UPI0036DEC9E8